MSYNKMTKNVAKTRIFPKETWNESLKGGLKVDFLSCMYNLSMINAIFMMKLVAFRTVNQIFHYKNYNQKAQ